MVKYKIIIDTNLWISFLIGKRLSSLKSLLSDSNFGVFVCEELLIEIQNISAKQKIQRYISKDDILDLFVVIDKYCQFVYIEQGVVSLDLRDAKDLYLLSMADTVGADFIITGDKDLLALQFHNQTKIVTYNGFLSLIS